MTQQTEYITERLTHMQEVQRRRTPEERERLLNEALEELRANGGITYRRPSY